MEDTKKQRRGVLVSSIQKRDEYIRTEFPNGYTVKRLTTLKELRDSLLFLIPLDQETPKQKTIYHRVDTNDHHSTLHLDEIKRFELFRTVIEHEDNLLNQRVSWIILAQSFLMAAFITSSVADSLRFVTAMVGLATVVVTMPAIVAAGRNIEVQQKVYFNMLDSDERCRQLHGHARDLAIKERGESLQRDKHGHLFPNMAFRSRTSLKILKTVVALAFVQFAGWCFLLVALIFEW
mmetsp:Transcript_34760/g.49347  ORF Transcript_34760/g.49347 Transcript_34760/m.49347 type:complete len:235 (+) Transcript_34760:3-707(+)